MYYNEYKRDFFWRTVEKKGVVKFYFKIDSNFIEVNEDIYKVCKHSYEKIRYSQKNEVARSVIHYENIDQATFFVVNKDTDIDIVQQIYIKDLANKAKSAIYSLPDKYREIAISIFINEFTEMETSKLLGIPKTTVHNRKVKIQEILKKSIKKTD